MQRRKGLTPIIAVVLLLMMTVAAAGLAYQFVIGTQSDVQDKVKSQIDTQLGSSEIKFDIDQAVKSGTNINFVLRNTGKLPIAAGSITVYGNGASSGTAPAAALDPGSTVTVTPGTAIAWPATGSSTTLRLVHSGGVSTTYTCTPASASASNC